MKKLGSYRTWLEIDKEAITHNAWTLKSVLGKEVMMMAVVKSNAYGHGMVMSAKAAIKGGAEWLGVDEVNEALELRAAGIKNPILVLGFTLPEYFKVAAQKNISLSVSSLDALLVLTETKLSKKLKIHLKFETGLHRQGIPETYVQQVIRIISSKKFPAVVEGVYTHFAAIEDPIQGDYSKKQGLRFKGVVDMLNQKGFNPITHASPSAGILFSKDFHFSMSRAGIALYGLWPSREIRKWAKDTEIIPALTWKTIVTEIKLVPKGSRVGYDLTHQLNRNSRLAIIPVGYWHGLPRALSNVGQVLVGGKKANIVGRVSMDITIIDVTDVPTVKPGDEVVIIGKQGKETISAEDVGEMAVSINYEIVTRINPLLPRILPLS
jgi:alanine racemase